MKPLISVIIPVYNEMAEINATVAHVQDIAQGMAVEIVVVDGGPGGETLNALDAPGVVKLTSAPGRGTQMNVGAEAAQGEIVLFLHADTRLPAHGFDAVARAIEGGADAGAFSLQIDSEHLGLKVVAWFANLRSRLEKIPYGDQVQFVRAEAFRTLGGYASIPIMEDVDLFRRIRQQHIPMIILPEKVATSSRRWDNEGILYRTLNNWRLRLLYRFGVSPEKLVASYRPHNTKADSQ